jgi:hypothetical protein
VIGVRASTPDAAIEVRADLVVGADGRNSIVREKAGLKVRDFGAPMDVLWFRLSRSQDDPVATMGRFDTGRIFITINRGEYWQCGYVIPKGRFEEMRRQGFETFRGEIMRLALFASDKAGELRSWDDVKLLTVRVDRLLEWFRPGLLCIGDAAHAMSPVGGVGINLAIQDAVAAGNILFKPLREWASHLRPSAPDPEATGVTHQSDPVAAGDRAAPDHSPCVGRKDTCQAATRRPAACHSAISSPNPRPHCRPRHPPGTCQPGDSAFAITLRDTAPLPLWRDRIAIEKGIGSTKRTVT